jgi:hypothetical protein
MIVQSGCKPNRISEYKDTAVPFHSRKMQVISLYLTINGLFVYKLHVNMKSVVILNLMFLWLEGWII